MIKEEKIVKRWIACFLAGILTCGSLSAGSVQVQAEEEAAESETVTQEPASDELLREDYYQYVNKDLVDSAKIPSGYTEWSWYTELDGEVSEMLQDDLLDAVENIDQYEKGSNEQMIADFYLTLLDADTRNTYGLGQLQPYVDELMNAKTIQEYLDAVAGIYKDLGVCSIINCDVSVDNMDSSRYLPAINSMKLMLDKETLEEESYADLMPEYEAYIALLLSKAGYGNDAENYASSVFDFLKEMASYDLPFYEMYYAENIYHPYTKEELDELYSNMDMGAFLESAGLDGWDTYLVYQEDSSAAVNEKLTEENLELLKAYSVACLLNSFSSWLSTDVYLSRILFVYDLYGLEYDETDEKTASELTQLMFPWEFSQIYIEEAFSEEEKEAVTEMVERIVERYRERIYELDWMEDETKEAAVKKLDAMGINVGYPDEWPNTHEGAEILGPEDGGSAIDNAISLTRAEHAYDREICKQEVDKNQWMEAFPTDVNAFNTLNFNAIFITAAILQPPFYDPDASDAWNYGAIGETIAHEITHSFDSTGSTYDENGNYNSWWTKNDAEKFEEMTQDVIDYYDTFTVDGLQVNGEQTLIENIADLGAIHTVSSFFEDDPEQLDELFRSFANMWASKYGEGSLLYYINSDLHSPDKIRVNATLPTLDCFYETYPEIQEGDLMYLAPEDRIRIW